MSAFRVRFWGTRGSIPAPGGRTHRYGGNTSCVEALAGQARFVLDAGTGIRELGDRWTAENRGGGIQANLLVTHTHWDHIQGFPFFTPAYVKGNRFRVHGIRGAARSFESLFRGLMDPHYFPVELGDMTADFEFVEMTGRPFDCGDVRVDTVFTNHPGMAVSYRLTSGGRSVTYLTDHETFSALNGGVEFSTKQDRLVEDFCRDTDLLISDAQYTDDEYKTKRGWGHSRYRDTVRLALKAGAKRLALFHHDPSHTDEEMDAIVSDARALVRESGRALECWAAQEGTEFDI